MTHRHLSAGLCCLMAFMPVSAWAGMQVDDPLYFSAKPPKVLFEGAEVKLVTFEFSAVGGDERGRQVAKELHDQFLAKIHDLHGGAIITFIAPTGKKIDNYRIEAVEIAKSQKAQMALWGRIAVDKSGAPLINARLEMIQPPAGISARYNKRVQLAHGPSVPVDGRITDEIGQTRINFSTLHSDLSVMAYFLSGLSRYYKGAKRSGSEAKPWLKSAAADFDHYIEAGLQKSDPAAVAIAHTYVARAYSKLADVDPPSKIQNQELARTHADKAAELNPYDPDIPTVQAVIAAQQNIDLAEIRKYLVKAVTLSPGNTTDRLNLALVESAAAQFGNAIKQVDDAVFVNKAQSREPIQGVGSLREQLGRMRELQRTLSR